MLIIDSMMRSLRAVLYLPDLPEVFDDSLIPGSVGWPRRVLSPEEALAEFEIPADLAERRELREDDYIIFANGHEDEARKASPHRFGTLQ